MPQSAATNPATHRKLRRSLQFALFATSLLWFVLADALAGRAARGLTNRFDLEVARPLVTALFLIFLLAVGFSLFEGVARTGAGSMRKAGAGSMRKALGLPRRSSEGREWTLGLAVGWGLAVAAVLPMALGRTLHLRFWTAPRAFELLLLNLATLAVATLALEIALRGYPFRRLIEAIGPAWATAFMAALLGAIHFFSPESTGLSVLITMMVSVLFSLAWLRTHGLWLGWGLHFAWNAGVALLFGLPVRGVSSFATVVQTRAIGRTWLTGDEFGPEGAFLTVVFLIAAMVVLVRATDEYAWEYTRPEIVPAGYEVNPEPPVAHRAMEQEAAAQSPALVQILPVTPQSRSVDEGR